MDTQMIHTAVLENISECIYVRDREGTILYMNPAAEKLSGWIGGSAIGKKCYDVFSFRGESCKHWCDTSIANSCVTTAPVERTITNSDGSYRNIKVKMAQISLASGLEGVVVIISDITEFRRIEQNYIEALDSLENEIEERKLTESALQKSIIESNGLYKEVKRSETLYKSLLNSSADAIVILNLNWKPAFVSPAFTSLFGWEHNDILEMDISDFLTSDSDSPIPHLKSLIDSGSLCKNMETRLFDNNRNLIDVSISSSRFNDADGSPSGILVTIRDISVRKQLEAQVLRSERLESIGTLAAGIAHEFNNILASVIGYSELAMDDAVQDSLQYSNLNEVLIAGKRATDLVQQILTFSNQTERKPEPVPVALILKETIRLIRASLPSTVQIVQNLQSDSCIMAEPSQVKQIIMNLATNSGHAMENEGGILSFELTDELLTSDATDVKSDLSPGQYVKLSIGDTGHGMSSQILSRAFNPFFTTKGQGEGSGMGLSVVHGIVTSLNGLISPYSEEGKGTTFHIYLPAIEPEQPSYSAAINQVPTGNERILIVDDEVSIIRVGKQILQRLGYTVEARTSSIEALELFRAKPDSFDLVITDMTMPNMTGIELTREILKLRGNTPVILCTGFSRAITEAKAVSSGIRAIVSKPILTGEMATTIRSILDAPENSTSKATPE